MIIAIAMSGGVDSSVAAALLKQAGHDVFGLTMQLLPKDEGRCCGLEAIEDARRTACLLGMRHYVLNLRDAFEERVVMPFCREYAGGRTPNPCVLCNNEIKFGVLWEKAAALGAEAIATGHYARVGDGRLKKGADAAKDQSYFLCRLSRGQVARAVFPVGHLTKDAVRRMAAEMGLPAVRRPESQEICFVPGGDYAGFISGRLGEPACSGPILDGEGNTLGGHRGITAYTIGQRRGLGIAAAAPLYVTAIQLERNAVIVGTRESIYTDELVAGELNWLASPPPRGPVELKARVRYRHPEAPATITPLEDGAVYVKFATPQMAITPGQTIAFYDGDTIIGGGVILRQGKEQ